MKAKELAEKLLENPDAIVAVWEGEPNIEYSEYSETGTCCLANALCGIYDVDFIVNIFKNSEELKNIEF